MLTDLHSFYGLPFAICAFLLGGVGWFLITRRNSSMSRNAKALIALTSFLCAGFVFAAVIPMFIKAIYTTSANACPNNLRLIDSAKQQWALEQNRKVGYCHRERPQALRWAWSGRGVPRMSGWRRIHHWPRWRTSKMFHWDLRLAQRPCPEWRRNRVVDRQLVDRFQGGLRHRPWPAPPVAANHQNEWPLKADRFGRTIRPPA